VRAAIFFCLVAGCGFETSYHLISSDDAIEYRDGRARAQFSLGPSFPAYRKLRLRVMGSAPWSAFLNGTAVGATMMAEEQLLEIPGGLLRGAGNLLEIACPANVRIELDGEPDATGMGPIVTKGPYLLAPTATSVTVMWETSENAASRLVVDGKSWDGGGGQLHRVRVDGLAPSRSYPYHVVVGQMKSDEASLTTAPGPGERVRVAVYGDNRTNGDTHRRMVQAVDREGPDFILTTGDMVGLSTADEWSKFFAIEYPLLVRTPLLPAIGNHEADFGDDKSCFSRMFPLGSEADGIVNSLDYGDVHVAALDSNGNLQTQAQWLDRDLAAARARGATHLFAILHWGPWSSGHKVRHGNNDEAQDHIVPILRRHGVDAVFSGHDHFYEHGESDSLRYFVSGGGGAPLDDVGLIYETRSGASRNHYLVVDVAGPAVMVEARDLAGFAFDRVEWTR
jgi:acid phosphatase type 7